MQAEDPSLKGLSVNKSKMLDFFVGKNSQSSASQVTDAQISKKAADDLERNTSAIEVQWDP